MKGLSKKRNTPVATLIKQYVDKRSGKVSESRRELHWRFDYLDWSQQKKIIKAHLDSCTSDRDWIYPRMLRLWDKDFEAKIKELWESYHEWRCSWLVVRYMPEAYIKEHFEELAEGRNYYFICLRFAGQEGFVVDREKLAPADYLTVMNVSGRDLSDADALDCLYRIVFREFSEPSIGHILGLRRRIDRVSLEILKDIPTSAYYLREMGKEEVVSKFEEWCDEVSAFVEPKVSELQTKPMTDMEYNGKVYALLMEAVAELLPDEYKQLHLNELRRQKQEYSSLIDKLSLKEELEVKDPTFFLF